MRVGRQPLESRFAGERGGRALRRGCYGNSNIRRRKGWRGGGSVGLRPLLSMIEPIIGFNTKGGYTVGVRECVRECCQCMSQSLGWFSINTKGGYRDSRRQQHRRDVDGRLRERPRGRRAALVSQPLVREGRVGVSPGVG
jgi:hypothetical protein